MQIDKLKKIIQSSHINFLLGSGLSCPYLSTLASIETWLTEANQISDNRLRLLVQDNLFIKYVEDVMKPCLRDCRVTGEELSIVQDAYDAFLAYIIHSGFISGYQNRYGDNLKPPTNVYHRMTA